MEIDFRAGRDMGDTPRRANAAKIAANMMIMMAIEATAEAAALTEANDLPRDRFFELILSSLFGGRAYESYSAAILRGTYEPGFKARLGFKDLNLAGDAALQAGKALPMLQAVRDRMKEVLDNGLGDRDWSIIATLSLGAGTAR